MSTLKQSTLRTPGEDDPAAADVPGLILVFSGSQPLWSLLRLDNGELELGRDNLAAKVQDGRISRRHARVFFKDGHFHAVDLGSLNGTSVDGKRLPPNAPEPFERCLRIGETLFLVCNNVQKLERSGITVRSSRVIGPRLARTYIGIARLARSSHTLHVTGESGAGKEDAARAFHSASPNRSGPFVAVNCATVPESIAERLLFGAKRGAYSGAAEDVDGYIQAANRGTLFLDEVAELHSTVQAKLLRVLENREVLALGAVRPVPVDVCVCSASHTSLRSQVAAGRLREDLYYRIGRPEILIPPLRERLEEIPWLIHGELGKIDKSPQLHFSFVEACLLRAWPGNIRELLVEVRTAAQMAIGDSSPRIESQHLDPAAGQAIKTLLPQLPPTDSSSADAAPTPAPDQEAAAYKTPADQPTAPSSAPDLKRAELEQILLQTGGNVAKAARALGLHRNALRRLMVRHKLDRPNIPGTIAPRGKR